MAWANSDRRQRLPKNWPALCSAVKRRANGLCEAQRHTPACDGLGRDVDHITQGDDHALTNLNLLSAPCHDSKTRAENAARNTLNAALKRRPSDTHPGRRT